MACYKSFAVVGAGSLGSIVVSEVLQRGAAVKLLTRDANKFCLTTLDTLQTFKDQGVTLALVDYANNDSIEAAFANADVVVSTVVARAAKTAGAKLFVPAEQYMHMLGREQCNWIRAKMEHLVKDEESKEKKMHILERLALPGQQV
ncbi:hypothetical protein PRIC1_009909 [Phytophthora ramorum]